MILTLIVILFKREKKTCKVLYSSLHQICGFPQLSQDDKSNSNKTINNF